eukprot:1561210-Pyramimonas_sp.AAC.1
MPVSTDAAPRSLGQRVCASLDGQLGEAAPAQTSADAAARADQYERASDRGPCLLSAEAEGLSAIAGRELLEGRQDPDRCPDLVAATAKEVGTRLASQASQARQAWQNFAQSSVLRGGRIAHIGGEAA